VRDIPRAGKHAVRAGKHAVRAGKHAVLSLVTAYSPPKHHLP